MAKQSKAQGNSNNNAPANSTPAPAHVPTNNPPTAPIKLGPTYQIGKHITKHTPDFTLAQAAVIRTGLQLTAAQLASGNWVKVATVHKLCNANNIPISLFVKAFGGDRATLPAWPCVTGNSSAGTNSHFTIMYYGRTRYLPSSSKTAGLQQLLAYMQQQA